MFIILCKDSATFCSETHRWIDTGESDDKVSPRTLLAAFSG